MAITTASTIFRTTAGPTESGAGQLARFVRSKLVALVRVVAHRRDVRTLLELDERSLRDIGLSRSDVIGALDQPFGVDPSVILTVRSVEQRSRLRRAEMASRPLTLGSRSRVRAA